MFGLVTRRELREAEARWKKQLEEMEHEWAGWYDKYKRLYARLMKRAQDTPDPAAAGVPSALPGDGLTAPRDWNEYIRSRRNHGLPGRS